MDFETLLALLREPGDQDVPETIYDDLTASYNDSLGIRDAKVNETAAALAAAQEEIARLKSQNYDLLMATAAEPAGDGDNDGDEDEDGADEGIDGLFEDEEN